MGVEPRPEVVKSISKDGTDGTDSYSQSNKKTDEDKEDRNTPQGFGSSSSDQSPTFPESSGSSNDPPLPTDSIQLQSSPMDNLLVLQLMTCEVYQSCVVFTLCYCTLVLVHGGFISRQSV